MSTPSRHRMSEQAAETAVVGACRMLRLPTIRAKFPDLAEQASREQMSYLTFLAELLLAECDDRALRRSERRIKAAAFPRQKSVREFVHRPQALHRDRRPAHLQRHNHRDRHRLLPTRPHPQQSRAVRLHLRSCRLFDLEWCPLNGSLDVPSVG